MPVTDFGQSPALRENVQRENAKGLQWRVAVLGAVTKAL